MAINETKFDELDIKFFKEFPFLVDVFASSFNRLSEIISFYITQIEKILNNSLGHDVKWTYKVMPASCTPFGATGKSIQTLSNQFTLEKFIEVQETIDKIKSKKFYVTFGFWYAKEFEENRPLLYFGIYVDESINSIFTIDFYESLKVENFKKVIEHQIRGNNRESIEIYIFKIDREDIQKGFEEFKIKILQPYLDAIKDIHS